jgi:3-keto-disaccharide hydrolase
MHPFFQRIPVSCAVILLSFAFAAADTVTQPIKLFNGNDLANFYTWLVGFGKNNDPQKVFSVQDGMIRVSGESYGGLVTEKEYENYRLVVEFKWGTKTFKPREKNTRDSGILLHCVGEDGGNSFDKKSGKPNGPWMESIECQMIEGGTGDIILVGGKNRPTVTVTAEKRGQWYYKEGGSPKEFKSDRINWWGRDPEWKDELGFRGKQDVENPVGQWNTLECVCAGDKLAYILNGKVVNAATNSSHTKGKILFQSEGAEVFFRRIDLLPLMK